MRLFPKLLTAPFLGILFAGIQFVGYCDLLPQAFGQDEPNVAAETQVASGDNFVAYAYRKTELQDYLLGSSGKHRREDYKAFVIVDGQSVFTPEGLLDPNKLDWDQLHRAVRELRVDENSVADFHALDCGPGDYRMLTWLLEGFGRNPCRFKHVYWRISSQRGDFGERIRRSQELARSGPVGDEAPIGNEFVQVFPVQTFLSRFHSDNADCVVRIVPQLVQQPQQELRGAIRASMLKFVPRVDVANKGKLLVVANYHTDARETIDWFHQEGFSQLADKLGYDEATGRFAEYSFLLKDDGN